MRKLFYKIFNFLNILYLRRKNCVIGKNVTINGFVYVSNRGKLVFGDNITINSGMRFNPIGGQTKTRLIVYENAELIIKDNVGISNTTIVCSKKIVISENVMIGGSCNILDTDFHSLHIDDRLQNDTLVAQEEINIHKNVFIGAHSIVLKGVNILENSILGAGSVCAKSIPANEIWAGNPIKYIRGLNENRK